ncbi:PAS domain-containing protein [Bdellovibrio sp. SKB1291214]|uniref:CheR family methyltransferase n=1 Tax=Bdellovibrio sp. SKB1291214 TaxID=1732569 RepID=UPI00223EC1D8|nr:CheR family methyltransferase [Bdellovibrio sp. SKB1291214]UYL09415.1 PAS domain-containing protein [Bdellovibrio sp. SKB1291214]
MPHRDLQTTSDWIIGVGASAGGLEAISAFVSKFTTEFQGSIVVAQHLAPHSKSMLTELIAKQATLPVLEARDGEKLASSTIYIVPPNYDVAISNRTIHLLPVDSHTRPKPSVDDFFLSLAKNHAPKIVGVILSGTGSDGSVGVRAIHDAGGITIAQSGDSAKYDGMPQSAVETSCIDSILNPEEMSQQIQEYITRQSQPARSNFSAEILRECLKFIQEKTGSDFSLYRPTTVVRRLQKRMGFLKIDHIEDYLKYLKDSSNEAHLLSQDLLISVTSFFRDRDAFDTLKKTLTELIYSKRMPSEIRMWVAGCATGEEAYSIAMLMSDLLDRLDKNFPVKIFATDLDYEALLEARNGVYKKSEVANIPSEYLHRYFIPRDGEKFEVSKKLREMVLFARQDMIHNPPFVKLDFISCRNVLIYFEPELQKKVLDIFHYALGPSGILFLGKSESLSSAATLFETLDKKSKVFRKLNVPSIIHSTRNQTGNSMSYSDIVTVKKRPSDATLLEKGMLRLLRDYHHCAVITDIDTNIIQVIGDVSHFVGFSSTSSDFRLVNLLPREVSLELPILIRKCRGNEGVHRSQIYKDKNNKKSAMRMVARALTTGSDAEYFLIDFENIKQRKTAEREVQGPVTSVDAQKILEIEQELYSTREHLQTVIEELGVANEEMQALNEELSSANEELQSANEELETTNEELQSSNEELVTVNDEIIGKSHELKELNINLLNVQESIGSGLIVVDEKRRILRFNKPSQSIFRISLADIGKDVTTLSTNLELPNFKDLIDETISKQKSSESFCESYDKIYQLRCQPFLDEVQNVLGAILLFVDTTELVRTSEKLEVREQQIRSIVEGFSNPITVKDHFGKYILVNQAFRDFFGLKDTDVAGKSDRELFSESTAISLRDTDLEVILTGQAIKKEEIFSHNGKESVFLVNRFPLFDRNRPYAVCMIATDVTIQKNAQHELRESESRYKAIIEDQAVLVCRHSPNGRLLFVNTVFANQFGGNAASHLGHFFHEYMNIQDQARVKLELNSLNPKDPVAQSEVRIYREDNSLRWVRWFHRGIFNADDELKEIQSVGFDVTDYRVRADRFLENESVFTTIFSNTSEVILILRRVAGDYQIEYLNNAASKLLEKRQGELVGKKLREVRTAERAFELIQRFNEVLDKKTSFSLDEHWNIPGVNVHMSSTLLPVPDANGELTRVAMISKDVSAYKSIEMDLRAAKEIAEEANITKSNFLASMSHELRTPLNVVLGMSHLLQETSLNQEQASYVSSIDRSSKALLSLIEDILDITKIESGKITLTHQAFNLSTLVSDAASMFEIQCQSKGVQLKTTIDKQADCTVIGDPGRLRQIIVNLLGNALKFTDRGHITLRLIVRPSENAGEIRVRCIVEDTGIGIAKEHHSKIFQRFSQVESGHSRRYGGSGLGLVISRQIATLMNGDMGFSSEPGKGSIFWFEAALQIGTRKQVEEETERQRFINQPPNIEVKGLKILAIDDNEENLYIIDLFLKRLGHIPTKVASGKEALALIEKEKFDIVLMDIQMPELDGYTLTKKIRALDGEKSEVVIIALTANAMSGDAERCKEAGMNDYITKPVRIDILKNTIAHWAPSLKGIENEQ